MEKTDLLNGKNFKKRILPILILISYKFLDEKMISYIGKNRVGSFSKSLLIGNFIFAVILFLLIKLIFKGKLNSIDGSEKMNLKKSIVISIAILFLTIGIIYGVMWIQSFLFSHISLNSSNASSITKEFKSNPLPVVELSFVTSTLEELVYRQLLFGYLYDLFSGCNKYIRYITSSLISAIIFGSIHDGLFHPAMIQYITHGFILSGLYLYTKRISSPIIVHVLFNLFLDIRRFIIYF